MIQAGTSCSTTRGSSRGGRTPSNASWRSGAWSGSTRSSWAGPTYPSIGQATGSKADKTTDIKLSDLDFLAI